MKKHLYFTSLLNFSIFCASAQPALFGLTSVGGTSSKGVILSYNPAGVVHSFSGGTADRQQPDGGLLLQAADGRF